MVGYVHPGFFHTLRSLSWLKFRFLERTMIKQLLAHIGEYKKPSLLAPLFVSVEVALEVLIPYFMAYLIDNGIDKGNMTVVWQVGVLLIMLTCIAMFMGVMAGRYAAQASNGFAKNLRRAMYHNVQDFSFANIDTFSTASIVTRLTTDVTNVQNAYQMVIRIAVRAPAMIAFSLIMAMSISPRLSLIFLILIPFLGLGLFTVMSNAHPIFEKLMVIYDRLNTVVQENVRGIRVVKSYVREAYEVEKFTAVSKNIYKNSTKAERILACISPLMQFSIYTGILCISWFGARLIVSHALTTGQLMSLITYATQMLMSLMMLSMVFVVITMSKASAKRIVEILKEKSDLHPSKHPVRHMKNGDVTFKNVSFSYTKDAEKLCLKHITLTIKSGETIGIVGGTGSSKTSLVQLIPRLYDATEGSVLVGDVDVKEYDLETLRNNVAMVLQKNVLFSGTIKENLRWGNEKASEKDMIHMCTLSQADAFIQNFPKKYDAVVEQDGANLSGGQKQRLCIARALLKKPKILILDDSTSAVDTKTESLIQKAFIEEIPNTTKFVIAQRISSIINADTIIVMDGGTINAVGTHDALLKTNAIYQEMYALQMKRSIPE